MSMADEVKDMDSDEFEGAVMASIPNNRVPAVTIGALSKDFGLSTHHKVAGAIKRLREKGHDIVVNKIGEDREVWMSDPTGFSKRVAEAYWQRMERKRDRELVAV